MQVSAGPLTFQEITVAYHAYRIRKVKCDEGRPSCFKCTSTGRTCDGYGVWGGEKSANSYVSLTLRGCNILLQPAPFSVLALNLEEWNRFEFFRRRSSKKIQGIFFSHFWDTLVFQVSLSEPAVLHALLALSSVQVAVTVGTHTCAPNLATVMPDKQEEFTLRQYIKAIGHLQPHLSAKHDSSIRVALVACVVFVCLDFFRGHNKSAQAHLLSGLKLLADSQGYSGVANECSNISNPSGDPFNDWIAEVFYRLHVQVGLFNQGYEFPRITLRPLVVEPQPLNFRSMRQARNYLDQLMDRIIHLRQLGLQDPDSIFPEMVERQMWIRAELESWHVAFKTSKANLLSEMPIRGEFAYHILNMYYLMGKVMAHTCIWPTCEGIYDLHGDDFACIIAIGVNLRKRTIPATRTLIGEDDQGIAKAIGDIGWIPPLYYTAIKCRVHRIRLQAIRLLDSAPHKELIWDAEILGAVAQKVMEIEERGFYHDGHESNEMDITKLPETQHFSLPTLPILFRIHEVRILLPDEPFGKIVLLCRQKMDDGSWATTAKEYDIWCKSWVEVGEGITEGSRLLPSG